MRMEPYFSTTEESSLRDFAKRSARSEGGQAEARFTSYFAVEPPRDVEPERIAREIADWPSVEIAYVEGGPTPPPVSPTDDPRNANQDYLDAAPRGIDARWAWGRIDGGGIGFVDLERGWTLDHEDLAGAGIAIISGLSRDYHGHGTAVLGEVVGVDNTLGGVGVAPGASARVVSQWRTASSYNTAEAILSAAGAMSAGDVLLLEAQTRYSTASSYVPVEVEQAVFDAIQFATSQGIIVVEAGANGSVDLDSFQDVNGKRILNRSSSDFRDSGAIMVGAGSSAAPHVRLDFSNFGSRIDCFAWGENIDTCGDGWTGTATNAYTTGFGGTSGASPIVTGAAILLQAWGEKRGTGRYSPADLRGLLSDASLNTASSDPASDRIGVMPNLRAILKHEGAVDFSDFVDRWRAIVWILFGVISDGGGIVIKPGTGPIPIDPWGPLKRLAAEKRDILVGLATTELGDLLESEASRRELNRAGVRIIQRAAESLGRKG
ncbi:MAG TPA: S8 family peptidase [Thermoanaerobaculia bacterium]